MKRIRKNIVLYMLIISITVCSVWSSKMRVEAVAVAATVDLMEIFTAIMLTIGVGIYIYDVYNNPDTGVLNPPTGWENWDEYNIVSWQWCYLLNMEEAGGGLDPGDPEDPDNQNKTGSKFWQWLQQYKVPVSAATVSMPLALYMAIKDKSQDVIDRYVALDDLWYAPIDLSDAEYVADIIAFYCPGFNRSRFMSTTYSASGVKFLQKCAEEGYSITGFVVDTSYNTGNKSKGQQFMLIGSKNTVTVTSCEKLDQYDGIKGAYWVSLDEDLSVYHEEAYYFDKTSSSWGIYIFNNGLNGVRDLYKRKVMLEFLGQTGIGAVQSVDRVKTVIHGSRISLPVDASLKSDYLIDPDIIPVTPGLEVTPEKEISGDVIFTIPDNLPDLIDHTQTGTLTLPEFSEELGVTPTPKDELEPTTGTDPVVPENPDPPVAPPVIDDPPDPPEDLTPYTPDIRRIFPFCIPFDFYDFISCLSAEPEAPSFTFSMPTGYSDGEVIWTDYVISLSDFDEVAEKVRTMELFVFVIGLMLLTRQVFIRS